MKNEYLKFLNEVIEANKAKQLHIDDSVKSLLNLPRLIIVIIGCRIDKRKVKEFVLNN